MPDAPRPLLPHDLGTAPLYLLRGWPAITQAVLLWVWQAELRGERWSLSSVARDAGSTPGTVKKVLEELSEKGVLISDENSTRAPYRVNCDFVPERPVPVCAKKPKAAPPEFPSWVWSALKIWRHRVGMIGPRRALDALSVCVNEYGEDPVLRGLDAYASETEAKFASPESYAARVKTWVG